MSEEPDYNDYNQEDIHKALKDAEFEKRDLDVIEAALESMQNSSLLVGSIQQDIPELEDSTSDVTSQVGETLKKIKRAVDVAHPPANRLDNQEAGIATEE